MLYRVIRPLATHWSCVALSFLIGFSGDAFSQGTSPHSGLLRYMPPSPSVAALGKFGNVPVSYATGIPNISIPIYSYKGVGDGLSLDVSLDYHAGGIRVTEKASNVGIGWALNAGGTISVEVRGIADELGFQILDSDMAAGTASTLTNIQSNSPYYTCYTGAMDAQPDIFSFSFNGHSGKFSIGRDKKAYLFPQQALTIVPTFSITGIDGFVITDEEGKKYYFNQKELQTDYGWTSAGNETIQYGSTWYLSKVTTPGSTHSIDLTYEDDIITYPYVEAQTYFKTLAYSPDHPGAFTKSVLQTFQNFVCNYKRLKTILFPNKVEIDFNYNPNDRCDITGDNALASVDIKNGTSIRSFKLDQNYSLAPSNTYNDVPCNLVASDLGSARLVLHRVTEYSGGVKKPPYIINYDQSVSIPSNYSFCQDHWGFYNGAYNNSNLIPYFNDVNAPVASDGSGTVDNANREINTAFSQMGIIQSIVYPTGGSTKYYFEQNTAAQGFKTYSFPKNTVVMNGMDATKTRQFNVKKAAAYVGSKIRYTFGFGGYQSNNSTCSINAYIKSVDGTQVYAQVVLNPHTPSVDVDLTNLVEGTYVFEYQFGSNCVPDLFTVTLVWTDIIENQTYQVGGLRVRKIEDYDGVSIVPATVREYSYVLADNQTSSGWVLTYPQYFYGFEQSCAGNCVQSCTGKNASYEVIASSPVFSLRSFAGNSVTYKRVEEKFTTQSGSTIGKVVRTYTADVQIDQGDLPMYSMSFPFIPLDYPEWVLGLLQTEETYDLNGLVKKVDNTYKRIASILNTSINLKGLKVFATNQSSAIGSDCSERLYWTMRMLDYYPTTGRSELTSTTETNYFSDGTSLVNTTLFEYDPNYFDVTKTTNYNSDGTIVENREYHPYHYTIAGSLLSEMTSNNIISPVVNREVYIKKTGSTSYQMTSGEIQEFQKTSENFIKPLKFDFFKSATPVDEAIVSPFVPTTLIRNPSLYEERVLFEKYDASGNLQQQRKANDQAVSYIWDYNSALPIAEIKNASQSDAAYTSFESTGTGNWSISPFVTDTSEGLTGTSCYNLASGSTLTFNLAASQNYSISLWAKPSTSVYINDVLQVSTGKTVKGWLLYSSQITGASSVTIKGTGKIDELRIAPTNAIINTATYDPLYGVIATVDPNNVITFYEYDLMGRLKLIRDEKNNITKRYEYNYQLK